MRHTIGVLTQNGPGVVARLSGLLERRGFQVDSVGIGATHRPDRARFTFVIDGDAGKATQAVRQLSKMVEAVEVENLSAQKHVARCMVLMKFAFPEEHPGRTEMKQKLFEALQNRPCAVVDDGENSCILEMTVAPDEADACLEAVRPFGLCEAVKSAPLALSAR